MPIFKVHFGGHADQSVEVDAEDYDTAIDAAYDKLKTDLCWNCSTDAPGFSAPGTVHREWPEVMEPYEVTVDGKTVWSEKSELEQLRDENAKLRRERAVVVRFLDTDELGTERQGLLNALTKLSNPGGDDRG